MGNAGDTKQISHGRGGLLQNQDGVVHLKAMSLAALSDQALELRSHDFH
jgi:hypothetical protein